MPSSLKRTALGAALVLAVVLFGARHGLAHRVSVFAWSEGERIVAEGYFSGGGAAKGAKIEVFDSSGKMLLAGKTDNKGRFSFPRPNTAGDLKIVLSASMGHKGEFVLAASEPGAAPTPAQPKTQAAPPKAQAAAPVAKVDANALEAALDRVLEKRLAPLYKMVADLKKRGASPTEIAGGIGYIVGILGLFAYFKSRGPKGGGNG